MPRESQLRVSSLTGQALHTMGASELKHKNLSVAEEDGVAEAAYALKLLQSDGRLRIATVGKYDATDQLVGADYNYQTDEAYAFDANGNRVAAGYVTGANNRTLSDGVYNYAYDAEGNRTLRTHVASGATTEYTWDHRNRLTGIVDKDGAGVVTGSVGYRYDPFNRRISKVISPGVGPAELEHFAYDGGSRAADGDRHIVLQFGVSGAVTHRYLHGPAVDQILADEQVDPGSGAANVLWPLTDHLGSVRDLAEYDEVTGITSIANHIVYGAFGAVASESNANVDCAFGFTGRETDPESDLNYYRARYYDPLLGQFIGEDPIGFDAADPNLRRYVGNGPMDATDPSGLDDVGAYGDEVWYAPNNANSPSHETARIGPGFILGTKVGKSGLVRLNSEFGGGFITLDDARGVAASLMTVGKNIDLTDAEIRELVLQRIQARRVDEGVVYSLYNRLSATYGGWLEGAHALREGIGYSAAFRIDGATVEYSFAGRTPVLTMAIPFTDFDGMPRVAYFDAVPQGIFRRGYFYRSHFGSATEDPRDVLRKHIEANVESQGKAARRVIPIYGSLETLADPTSRAEDRNVAVSLLALDMVGGYFGARSLLRSGYRSAAPSGTRLLETTVDAPIRGPLFQNPSQVVTTRVGELRAAIPAAQQGRVTMAVAVVEDSNGVRSVLVSTSEPRGYLRPGVTLRPGETMVAGTGHAEADIIAHAKADNLRVVDIGATRPVCVPCQDAINPTGANMSTPLRPRTGN